MTQSVYLHVPFCGHICKYCAFYRHIATDNAVIAWKDKLVETLKNTAFPESLETLYFGGGTPSLLDEKTLAQIRNCFPQNIGEFTVEIDPDTLTQEKAELYHKLGVNRASLGIQTFDDDLLGKIGRKHTAAMAVESVNTLRNSGITNISADLIYALPGQSLQDVKNDVEKFLELDLPHLSIYSLQIEENSVFGRQHLQPCDEDLEADMYEWIVKRLKSAGYDHYEISSFARNGQYSRHNLAYWTDGDFMGIGPGASGREQGRRYHIDSNWQKINDETDGPFEDIMMGLRTRFGVELESFEKRYGFSLTDKYSSVLDKWKFHFRQESGRLYLDEAGREVLNTILLDFMD